MASRKLLAYALFAGYFVLLQMIYYVILLSLAYGGFVRYSDVLLGVEMKTWVIVGSLLLMFVTYLTMAHVYRLFRLLPPR